MIGRGAAPHFLAAVAGRADDFALRIVGNGMPLAAQARLAGDSRGRRRGLLDAVALPPGQALVIAPTQGIHTFGMRFTIDVVFVDRQGRVVRIADDVGPRRLRLSWRAFAAIELPAGVCRQSALAVGDVVEATPRGASGAV